MKNMNRPAPLCGVSCKLTRRPCKTVQSTHPRGVRHLFEHGHQLRQIISTHAPREGCDQSLKLAASQANQFQSTHPARGATAYAGKQSYQSNEQNGIEYVTYTLMGYDTQWGQEDTYKLLLPGERAKGLRIKREMKVFLRGDTAAQAAWLKAMREIGAYCSDEIRALDDLPAIPGGKEYYSSLNYVPLELWRILSIIRALGKAAGVPEEPPLGEDPEGAEDPPVKEGEKTNE